MHHYSQSFRNDRKSRTRQSDAPLQVSLQTLLVVPLVVQVLIVVGLTGWLAHRNGQRAVQALAHQLLDTTGERLRERLETYTATPRLVTQQNADILELGQLDPTNLEGWAPHLLRQSDRFPEVAYIYYGNREGSYIGIQRLPDGRRELAVKTPQSDRLQVYRLSAEGKIGALLRTSTYAYDHRQRPWYEAATASGRPQWTDPYEFTGLRPQLGISFVRPHSGPEQSIAGVLGADFTLLAVDRFLADLKISPASETLLMRTDGTIIASSEDISLGEGVVLPDQSLSEFAVDALTAQLGELSRLTDETQIQFRAAEAKYWAQVTPFMDDYGLQWLGVSVLPEADFTAEVRHNNRNTALMSLLALILSTGASLLIAQRLNRPIRRLGLASQAIAQGNPTPPIAPSRIREVNLLVQSFNRMVEDLSQSRSQLSAYSQQLETLVEQRTQALHQSEEKFSVAFWASPNGVVLTTFEEGRYVEVNDRFAELIERPKAEILGCTSTELKIWVAPYSRADYVQQLTTGRIRNQECQFRTASGAIKTVLLSSELIDMQGVPHILSITNDISDRQQAQNALAASRAQYQRLVDEIGDKFVIFSHTGIGGVVTYVSGGLTAVFGLRREEIVGHLWGESISWLPEDAEMAQAAVVEAAQDGVEFQQFEMRFTHPNRQQRTVLVSQHPVRDAGGSLVAIEGILEDITARKLTETRLRRNEAQLATAQRIAHVGNWEIDLATRKTTWSPELLKIFGFDTGGLPPTYAEALRRLHPEDHERWTALFRRLMRTGAAYKVDLRVVLPSGELRHIEGRGEAIRDERGAVVRVLGTGLDVTARKRAEDELVRQFQRQKLLANITHQIRQSLDIQSVYQTTADEVGRAFGVSRCLLHTYVLSSAESVLTAAQYLAPGCASMRQVTLPVDGPYAQAVLTSDRAIATPDIYQDPRLEQALKLCEQFNIRSILAICTSYQGKHNGFISLHECDRQRHWTLDEISLLEAVAAQVGIAIAQARLLRQEQRQREQLAQQNIALDRAIHAAEAASAAKSEFLANMSHELRTPLNAILGFSHLMAQDANLTSAQTTNLGIINRSGEHLLELINGVLDMSKIESGRTTLYPVDVHLPQLLTDLIALFELRAREKGIALTLDLALDVPTYLYIDAGKLRQVLVNLLSNALKSTESGAVTLRVTPVPVGDRGDGGGNSGGDSGGDRLRLDVEDTGCGIDAAAMPQIFEAFMQHESGLNTRSGTGLGLTITQKFVELMGGQIAVSSGGMTYTPGQPPQPAVTGPIGSRFSVTMPVTPGRPTEALPATPQRQIIGLAEDEPPRRILIAEDCWESSYLLEQTLSPLGFEVRVAGTGEAAVEIWRAWHPDLIWMDMRMPVMDGYQATRYIRAQPSGQETVIIALTASSLESDRAKVMSAGCDDYLRKPFRADVLLEKIADHIGVRYRYKPHEPLESALLKSDSALPIQGQWAALEDDLRAAPPTWTRRLLQAARTADSDQIAELMGDRHGVDPSLRQIIRAAVDNFRYEILIETAQTALAPPLEDPEL